MVKKSLLFSCFLMSSGLSFGANDSLVPIPKVGPFAPKTERTQLIEDFTKKSFDEVQARFDAMSPKELQDFFTAGQKTWLHRAIENENIAAVRYFFDRDMDVNALDQDNKTPLYRAIHSCQSKIALILIQTESCNSLEQSDDFGNTLLHKAILNYNKSDNAQADLALIRELVVRGADVNAQSNNGKTPLFDAASQGLVDVVRVLVDAQDIEINTCCLMSAEIKKATPLYAAVYNGFHELVDVLLEAGALPDLADNNGETPLHVVIGRAKLMSSDTASKIIKALMQYGADTSIVSAKGETAKDWVQKYAQENFDIRAAFGEDVSVFQNAKRVESTSIMRVTSRAAWILTALGSGYKMNGAFQQAQRDIIAENKAAAEKDETVELITDKLKINSLAGERLWKEHKALSIIFFASVLGGVIDVSAWILGS